MSYCVRILNESRQGMGLYAAPFWEKSKNRSQVAFNLFPAEMAKSMEIPLKNLGAVVCMCKVNLVKGGQGGGS